MRSPVNPAIIRWARERSGLKSEELEKRFPALAQWETGAQAPTFKQLQDYGKATLAPYGAFFLADPPVEKLPLPDFRTVRNKLVVSASAALLTTIYQMQRRQDWLREFLIEEGAEGLDFVSSASVNDDPKLVAQSIRRKLNLNPLWAAECKTWTEALVRLRRTVEDAGVLVVVNGIVENNTHKKLDPEEFRGFVLSDKYAPLIFINGADFKAAQMFTLAHELAHLWVGADALVDLHDLSPVADKTEIFCNAVAAELLVPEKELKAKWPKSGTLPKALSEIASCFKVSPMVAARRAFDLGFISDVLYKDFLGKYQDFQRKIMDEDNTSGGDFYRSQMLRVGKAFGTAVVSATRSGRLSYKEAYRLTGLHGATFDKFAEKLGF